MGIYDPSPIEIMIYICIFAIGVIVGRIMMAIQGELMKNLAKAKKKQKLEQL
jgi:hypothetical protein